MEHSSIGRRGFLITGGVTAAALATSGRAFASDSAGDTSVRFVKRPVAGTSGGLYAPNRSPLAPTPFLKLPPGAVRARGWLGHQLRLQLDGLCGRYDQVSDFLDYDTCGWVHPEKNAWEELPYWLRGFGDLAYVTGDERALATTRRWLDGIIATQQADGWFGPARLRTSLENGPDFWPGMPLLSAFRSWYEYAADERVVPFMTKYFRFQADQPPEVFNRSWGAFRWGDNIDSVYWLYNRTGESWLLDLVEKMHSGSADYVSGLPTRHNVNIAQGFREPLQYGLLAKDLKYAEATYRNYATVMGEYGQFAGGGFAGDENTRDGFGDPRQGFETCGIVEFMHSFEMLTRFTGDPVWTDRCEELAINLMPAAFDPEQRSVHYITSANSVRLDRTAKVYGQFQNGFAMEAYLPGVHNYRCCPHNYGMGWPYYVEELWLATHDGGLAASMYADSTVTARVAGDRQVTIDQRTGYPFDDTVRLSVSTGGAVAFPLYLRVPGWCAKPRLWVGGRAVPVRTDGSGYLVVERTWRDGDRIELTLPMRTSVRTWTRNHGSVSVDHGPLTFSLAIEETWKRTGGTPEWPEYEVFPASPWNYALDRPEPDRFRVVRRRGDVPDDPFTPRTAPLELRAKARKIDNWRADPQGVVRVLQDSPARTNGPGEEVRLIPMGAARLRITSFPVAGTGPDAHEWTLPEVEASASHAEGSVLALYDGRWPSSSADHGIPRFTWWDHLGTAEWVQYEYAEPVRVESCAVYWFDDTGIGRCRVPASWELLWLDGGQWRPVTAASGYGVAVDAVNRVTFAPVVTRGIRIAARLRDGFSAGILEWEVPRTAP
ncbi:beta-L-arabinofuranosidase domain-containing protein [Actinomadura alba]|uniref:Glycoside hydrolase family 127 protein n=1 Tax=Actinomadura alba TaxID=406431 RepID=A0ABR7M039_9ACTN|nr:beta-L-arabinofuranosidase domain-containing protein [Actinomadura alba]MBC6470476.1 glycoside hydrolase family 127 protein [Actinomadura alba]